MAYKNYRDLLIWQKSNVLAKMIYDVTRQFPKEELFALGSQMRRAAVSVPSNIAEGHVRESNAEFNRFLLFSIGSICELDTQIEIAFMQNYINIVQKEDIQKNIEEIRKMIYRFRKTLNTENRKLKTEN